MTVITDETAGAARRRTDLIVGLNRLIDHIAAHGADDFGDEPLTRQLPVPRGLDHAGKLAWLKRKAAEWGAEILPDGMGGHRAEKSFGAVRLVASVACPDRGFSELKSRAAALRSSIGANGATA